MLSERRDKSERCERCNGWGDDGNGNKSCPDCESTGFKTIENQQKIIEKLKESEGIE